MAKKALGRGMDSLFEPTKKGPEKKNTDKAAVSDHGASIAPANIAEKAEEAKTSPIKTDGESQKKEFSSGINPENAEKNISVPDKNSAERENHDENSAKNEKKEEISHTFSEKDPAAAAIKEKKAYEGEIVRKIPVERIRPNMYQPRRNFDESSLQELAESIKASGLLQPITVWKDQDREYYEIIAGERRLRACKMAGLSEIDAIVKENLSDDRKLELALIENIQREDLNAIDTAMAYMQLIEHFRISQAEISRMVGKSRAAISNTLRLMELEENIRNAVRSGLISEGHARALLSIPDKIKRQEIFQRIIAERLSVREAEAIAQNYHYELPVDAVPINAKRMSGKSPEIIDIQSMLSRHFGSKVEIKPGANGKKGKIVISYYSLDDFERITSILQK